LDTFTLCHDLVAQHRGAGCALCQYPDGHGRLDFHHIQPKYKSFDVSSTAYWGNVERLKIEIEKCVVLCHSCHARVHAEVIGASLPLKHITLFVELRRHCGMWTPE